MNLSFGSRTWVNLCLLACRRFFLRRRLRCPLFGLCLGRRLLFSLPGGNGLALAPRFFLPAGAGNLRFRRACLGLGYRGYRGGLDGFGRFGLGGRLHRGNRWRRWWSGRRPGSGIFFQHQLGKQEALLRLPEPRLGKAPFQPGFFRRGVVQEGLKYFLCPPIILLEQGQPAQEVKILSIQQGSVPIHFSQDKKDGILILQEPGASQGHEPRPLMPRLQGQGFESPVQGIPVL